MNKIFLKYKGIFYLFSFENLEFLKGNANGIIVSFPFFMTKFLKIH